MNRLLRQTIKKTLRNRGWGIVRVPRCEMTVHSVERFRAAAARAMESGEKIKLHFGAGPRVLKGWFNIDLEYCDDPRYVNGLGDKYPPDTRGGREAFYPFDVTTMPLPLPSGCVDVVFHEDFIEHLTQRDQFLFLAETRRVMKAGAVQRVNTPNLAHSMRVNSKFDEGFTGVFVHEWNHHGHLNVLTPPTLEEMARLVGYSQVIFTGRDGSRSPEIPPEFRPGPGPNDRGAEGNLFADLIK
jgi:Methyltransferase domain